MSEFQDIQRLMRLKRFEMPGEDFVEDFVTQFRERQRSELLRQSARGLLWERVSTYFDDLISPKWATIAATAAVSVFAAWGTMNMFGSNEQAGSLALHNTEAVMMPVQPSLNVNSELIREAEQGRQLEIEGILLSRHFESEDVVSVAGVSGAAMPVSAELLPVSGFGP